LERLIYGRFRFTARGCLSGGPGANSRRLPGDPLMRNPRRGIVGLSVCFLLFGSYLSRAGQSPPPAPASVTDTDRRDAQAVADTIDQLVAARWAASGVKPALPADDAAFM